MDRKTRIEICENCTHCKRDINRGIVCGLTNEYATFEALCPEFYASDSYIEKLRARKDKKEAGPNLIRSLSAVIGTYLFCLISMLVGEDNPSVTWVLLAAGVVIIGISLCIFFRTRSRDIWRDHSKLNRSKIKEMLRVEGYSQQAEENDVITFKVEGESYGIAYERSVFQLMHGFHHEEDIDTARAAALKVMDNIIVAKITVRQNPEQEQDLRIIISAEILTDSAEEITQRFADYVTIVRVAKERFAQALDDYHKQHQKTPVTVTRRKQVS